jgi:molybdopterin-guanine dinucleotide biosynthesis protein A
MNDPRANLTALVLAGGLSSRFGSNKALAALSGRTLVRHVVDRISQIARETIVVIGRGEPPDDFLRALPRSVNLLNDELEGKTPLVGILRGLRVVETDYALILSCDIPFINWKVIELLHTRASGFDAAIPRWESSKIEPLEAIYRVAPMVKATERALAAERLSLLDAIEGLERVVYVPVEDEIRMIDPKLETFFNINTKADLALAERMLSRNETA